ncbi:MAG: methyltransferase domain-containing protein [bacterium]|nr:methyltransferase domain-containing protein [bacterium]
MICTFSRGNEETAYQLDAGNHYTFRYDENQELDLYYGSHGRADAVDLAPYVGTPPRVFRRMLELAKIRKDDILYDLGCGDGRIVIAAARTFGSRGVGIDINPSRIKESESNAKAANVEDLTDFRQADVTNVDFSEATIVTLYLLPESNQLLRPLLEEQLQLGTTVISHNYAIPGWKDKLIDEVVMTEDDNTKHWIYVYLR